MVRIGAIFTALCMVLIAASLGAVLFLRFGLPAADSALAALGLLTVLAFYNTVSGRRRDRAVVNDQLASLARGSGDLARQLAEALPEFSGPYVLSDRRVPGSRSVATGSPEPCVKPGMGRRLKKLLRPEGIARAASGNRPAASSGAARVRRRQAFEKTEGITLAPCAKYRHVPVAQACEPINSCVS